jgi:hypothetical protein
MNRDISDTEEDEQQPFLIKPSTLPLHFLTHSLVEEHKHLGA